MPFVLLVMGLLGGGLVTLLLLNTILAQGSFALDSLQKRNAVLSGRAQALEQDVARAQSPGRLARRARALGMVRVDRAGYVDVRNGKVYGGPQPGEAPPSPKPARRAGVADHRGAHGQDRHPAHGRAGVAPANHQRGRSAESARSEKTGKAARDGRHHHAGSGTSEARR